jgi:hypothetical protein
LQQELPYLDSCFFKNQSGLRFRQGRASAISAAATLLEVCLDQGIRCPQIPAAPENLAGREEIIIGWTYRSRAACRNPAPCIIAGQAAHRERHRSLFLRHVPSSRLAVDIRLRHPELTS